MNAFGIAFKVVRIRSKLLLNRNNAIKMTYYKKYVRLSATEIGRNLFVVATQFILHLAKHGSSIKMTQITFL